MNKSFLKIEEECQLAKRMTERFLKSLNREIFNVFMKQYKKDGEKK